MHLGDVLVMELGEKTLLLIVLPFSSKNKNVIINFFLDGRKNGYVGGVEYFAATIRKYSLWDYQS